MSNILVPKDLTETQREALAALFRAHPDVKSGALVPIVRSRLGIRMRSQGIGSARRMLAVSVNNGPVHNGDNNITNVMLPPGPPRIIPELEDINALDTVQLRALCVHLTGENRRLKDDIQQTAAELDRKRNLIRVLADASS